MGPEVLAPRFQNGVSADPLAPLSPPQQPPPRTRASSDGNQQTPLLGSTPPTLLEDEVVMAPEDPLRQYTPTPSLSSEPRRLSSSLPASTSIVETLFGPGLGPCWGDFSCTYNRIRGRLYATSQAVLFYTNLLGFERRICLLLRDILHVELYRTTSLRFSTVDDETYIFKSFNDREQVLHLINGLKMLVNKQEEKRRRGSSSVVVTALTPVRANLGGGGSTSAGAGAPTGTGTGTNLPTSTATTTTTNRRYSGNTHPPTPSSTTNSSPPLMPAPQPPSRQRAASDSILRLPRIDSPLSILAEDPHYDSSLATTMNGGDDANHHTGIPGLLEDEEDVVTTSSTGQQHSMATLWNKAKQTKYPPLQEIGVDGLVLPVDMDTFFETFWADHAQYSLDYYQREYIKDKEVQLTGWDLGSDGFFRRTLQFRHPISNSLGIGPSAADTTRQQKLRTYTGHGITLENKTIVAGIPAADSFYVQDHWVVEAVEENQVKLTVRYDTRFTKRSMFKSIISESIRKETKEWMVGYMDMVQSVLAEKSSLASQHSNLRAAHLTTTTGAMTGTGLVDPAQLVQSLQTAYQLVVAISLAFFGLGVVVCWQLYSLQTTIAKLGDNALHYQVCPQAMPHIP